MTTPLQKCFFTSIHPTGPQKKQNTQTPGVTLFYWRADRSITRVSCWALRLAIKFRFLNISLVLMFLFHLLTSGSSSRNEQSGKEIGFETFFPLELILGNSKTNTNTHQKWINLWSSIKKKKKNRQNHLWLSTYKLTLSVHISSHWKGLTGMTELHAISINILWT